MCERITEVFESEKDRLKSVRRRNDNLTRKEHFQFALVDYAITFASFYLAAEPLTKTNPGIILVVPAVWGAFLATFNMAAAMDFKSDNTKSKNLKQQVEIEILKEKEKEPELAQNREAAWQIIEGYLAEVIKVVPKTDLKRGLVAVKKLEKKVFDTDQSTGNKLQLILQTKENLDKKKTEDASSLWELPDHEFLVQRCNLDLMAILGEETTEEVWKVFGKIIETAASFEQPEPMQAENLLKMVLKRWGKIGTNQSKRKRTISVVEESVSENNTFFETASEENLFFGNDGEIEEKNTPNL